MIKIKSLRNEKISLHSFFVLHCRLSSLPFCWVDAKLKCKDCVTTSWIIPVMTSSCHILYAHIRVEYVLTKVNKLYFNTQLSITPLLLSMASTIFLAEISFSLLFIIYLFFNKQKTWKQFKFRTFFFAKTTSRANECLVFFLTLPKWKIAFLFKKNKYWWPPKKYIFYSHSVGMHTGQQKKKKTTMKHTFSVTSIDSLPSIESTTFRVEYFISLHIKNEIINKQEIYITQAHKKWSQK